MKVTQIKQEFSPVTITLESKEELDMLFELSASVSGTGKVRDFYDALADNLQDSGATDPGNLVGGAEAHE